MFDKVLVFDLDATLYYAGNAIEQLCDKKVCDYISDKLQITDKQAQDILSDIRKKYHFETDAIKEDWPFSKKEFVEYVCDVDVGILSSDKELDDIICQIPNKKYILTDSTSKHVKDTLKQISLNESHFSGICDAHDMQYTFKHNTEGYNIFFDKYSLSPTDCVIFEDNMNNIEVAKSLGMTTVLISPDIQNKPLCADYLFTDIKTALRKLFFLKNKNEFLTKAIYVAKTYDVSTSANKLVLYSISFLPTKENRDKAFAFVEQNPEYMTIENTPCGAKLVEMNISSSDKCLLAEDISSIWAIASERMIKKAKGNVTAFVDNADSRSVFCRIELPAIIANSSISTINGEDKYSFAKHFSSDI